MRKIINQFEAGLGYGLVGSGMVAEGATGVSDGGGRVIVGVSVGVLVLVGVNDAVGEGVIVGVQVRNIVGVSDGVVEGVMGVLVALASGVRVGVAVREGVNVMVGEGLGVALGRAARSLEIRTNNSPAQ
jgi:hypothetical protein